MKYSSPKIQLDLNIKMSALCRNDVSSFIPFTLNINGHNQH